MPNTQRVNGAVNINFNMITPNLQLTSCSPCLLISSVVYSAISIPKLVVQHNHSPTQCTTNLRNSDIILHVLDFEYISFRGAELWKNIGYIQWRDWLTYNLSILSYKQDTLLIKNSIQFRCLNLPQSWQVVLKRSRKTPFCEWWHIDDNFQMKVHPQSYQPKMYCNKWQNHRWLRRLYVWSCGHWMWIWSYHEVSRLKCTNHRMLN